MVNPIDKLQADFDRIAVLSQDGWDHNSHYHNLLLRHVPPQCVVALEIGCGTGAFSRLSAKRSSRVLALDVSPEMIRIAKERSRAYPNIDFRVADAVAWEYPIEQYDCVVSIATLHHLPFEEMLEKMKSALKGEGTLLVLDLFRPESLSDVLKSKVALVVDIAFRLTKLRQLRESSELRDAWAEHIRRDSYPTLSQVREMCRALLPGASVRGHLLWRYSIIWKKTARVTG